MVEKLVEFILNDESSTYVDDPILHHGVGLGHTKVRKWRWNGRKDKIVLTKKRLSCSTSTPYASICGGGEKTSTDDGLKQDIYSEEAALVPQPIRSTLELYQIPLESCSSGCVCLIATLYWKNYSIDWVRLYFHHGLYWTFN
ncbi:hypothetical protein VNO78_18802 [Psophocarpus tetragonolobus]|uniref:Uncharacterized protein n=1 Tax=Psophocarpus tetragonolobus TaxID=3891 RepID=A0AAN9S810_PSOTE